MANEAKEHDDTSIPAAYKAQLNHYLQFIRLEKGLSAHSVQSYEHDLKRYFQFLVHHAKVHDIAGVTMTHKEIITNVAKVVEECNDEDDE